MKLHSLKVDRLKLELTELALVIKLNYKNGRKEVTCR